MVSSPGRIETVRTTSSVPSDRLEHVAGAHDTWGQDRCAHCQQPVALAVDGLEHRGVPRDTARLGPGGHDAAGDADTEPEPHLTQVRLPAEQLGLALAVEQHVGAEPAAVPGAE